MLGNPKYSVGDRVVFWDDKMKMLTGKVVIVDAFGTYFQTEEPSYDILVRIDRNKVLYKHNPERNVLLLSEYRQKSKEKKCNCKFNLERMTIPPESND